MNRESDEKSLFFDVWQKKRVKFFVKSFWYNYYMIKMRYVVMNRNLRRKLRKEKNSTWGI